MSSNEDHEQRETEREEEDVKVGVARVVVSSDESDDDAEEWNVEIGATGTIDNADDVKIGVARAVTNYEEDNEDNDECNMTAHEMSPGGFATDASHVFQDLEKAKGVARIEFEAKFGSSSFEKGDYAVPDDESDSIPPESTDGVARIETGDTPSSPPKNEKGVLSVPSIGDGRRGRQRAMVPGAQYIQRRAPGMTPAAYIERARRQARASALLNEIQAPIQSDASARVTVITAPAESAIIPTLRLKESRTWCYVYAFIAACIVIGVAVAVSLSIDVKNKHNNVTVSSAESTTQFGPFTTDCNALSNQTQPNFMSQCLCTGNLSTVASDIAANYDGLAKSFLPTLLPDFKANLNSCTLQNQALVWLASGDGMPTDSDMRQRYLLALLFLYWNGPSWLANAGWLSPDDECTWFGITCDGSNDVTVINLSSKNLTGLLQSEIALLTSLTSLTLDLNNLRGTLPTELSKLSVLQELSLAFNAFSGSIPSEYGMLSELTSLVFSSNSLVGTLPTQLGLLCGLQVLKLSNNNVTGEIPSHFGLMSSLQAIALDNNALGGTIPSEIGLWQSAQQIDFGFNSFVNGTIPTEIGLLSDLETISCSLCGLNGTLPEHLFGLLGLQNIVLTSNHLQGTISPSLGQLTSLGTLNCLDTLAFHTISQKSFFRDRFIVS
jgi:Leucine-rich repeat (LRR) protein